MANHFAIDFNFEVNFFDFIKIIKIKRLKRSPAIMNEPNAIVPFYILNNQIDDVIHVLYESLMFPR